MLIHFGPFAVFISSFEIFGCAWDFTTAKQFKPYFCVLHFVVFVCWGGYLSGTIEIAAEGQAFVQIMSQIHLVTSIMLFYVFVAPVGQI